MQHRHRRLKFGETREGAASALFNTAAPLGLAAFTEPFNLYSSEAKFFIAKRINVYDFVSCSSKKFRIPTESGDFGHGGSSANFGCLLKYQCLPMDAQHSSSIKQSRTHRRSIPVLMM